MNYQEKFDLLYKIGKECPVNEWKHDSIRVWPFVLYDLNRVLTGRIKVHGKKSRYREIRYILKFVSKELLSLIGIVSAGWRDREHNSHPSENAEFVFLTQSSRRTRLGENYYDRICDPYIDALESLGKKCLALEWTYEHRYRIPRANKSAFIQLGINSIIARNLVYKKYPVSVESYQGIDCLLDGLAACGLQRDSLVRQLNTNLSIVFSLRDYFVKKLRKIKPNTAFLFPYFGMVGFGFVLACRELGIKAVDIQHGYYADVSPMYNAYSSVPDTGYEMLPDYFWCWENRDAQKIVGWGNHVSNNHVGFVGGNLWNNLWADDSCCHQNDIDTQKDAIKARVSDLGYDTNVLVTFSPFAVDIDELCEAIRLSEGSVCWWLRFHHNTPADVLGGYKKALGKHVNVETDLSNRLALPGLLSNLDAHATFESSCAAEAKNFSTRTVVMSEEGASMYSDLLESGWGIYAGTAVGIVDGVLSCRRKLSGKAEVPERDNRKQILEFLKLIG